MDSELQLPHNYLRGTENAYQDAIHGLEFIQKFAEKGELISTWFFQR